MRDRPESPAVDHFILLYALAWAGGAIGYMPLLSILMPVRVEELAGVDAGVDWLARIALFGAIAASLGGIGFGYLSDITRNRRGWIAAGLGLSTLLLINIGAPRSQAGIIAMICCWQLALNMMLGPLAAWAGDVVPDSRKGFLGGLMAFAPGAGALAGAFITIPGLADSQARLLLTAALTAACVLPLLCSRAPAASDAVHAAQANWALRDERPPAGARTAAIRMWVARLAVQVAEATLFAYLYFWLLSMDEAVTDSEAARLFGVTMVVAAPLALVIGRWSDRENKPILPLQVCAVASSVGLVVMAIASDIAAALPGYFLFGVASAVFLALHASQTLRFLPRTDRRGRDLGVFNLANTAPSIVMPWLVFALVPHFGFGALLYFLAILSAAAAVVLSTLSARR